MTQLDLTDNVLTTSRVRRHLQGLRRVGETRRLLHHQRPGSSHHEVDAVAEEGPQGHQRAPGAEHLQGLPNFSHMLDLKRLCSTNLRYAFISPLIG